MAQQEVEFERWATLFLEGGENSLRANPRDQRACYEARIKDLQVEVGELSLLPMAGPPSLS